MADEPTGNLDSRTAEAVFAMFERLIAQHKTILMVTHDNDLAKRVTRALHVHDGEIVDDIVHRPRGGARPGHGTGELPPLPERFAEPEPEMAEPRTAGRGDAADPRAWTRERAAPSRTGASVDMRHPRWAKVLRDLTQHPGRSALVVLSIAVGIFAVAVVLGGRAVLVREFEKSFAVSNPMNATLTTAPFDDHVLKRVQSWPGVRAADGRQVATMRYRRHPGGRRREAQRRRHRGAGAAEPARAGPAWTSGRSTSSASRTSAASRWTGSRPSPGASWPPEAGEILLERSAQQAGAFAVGDLLLVEKADGTRTLLRVAGFAHDINSIPAMFQGKATGFVSWDTLPLLGLAARATTSSRSP